MLDKILNWFFELSLSGKSTEPQYWVSEEGISVSGVGEIQWDEIEGVRLNNEDIEEIKVDGEVVWWRYDNRE